MTNEELIDKLRNCNGYGYITCRDCPFNTDVVTCKYKIKRAAADALEADDKRIEQLEKQVEAYKKLAKRCEKQMCKIERENDELHDKLLEKIIMLQRTKEGYVDVDN